MHSALEPSAFSTREGMYLWLILCRYPRIFSSTGEYIGYWLMLIGSVFCYKLQETGNSYIYDPNLCLLDLIIFNIIAKALS